MEPPISFSDYNGESKPIVITLAFLTDLQMI